MFDLTEIKDIFNNSADFIGRSIKVGGWVRTTRESKNANFIELNDGTNFSNLQIVFDDNLANAEEVKKASIGSSFIITGDLVESTGAGQPFELRAKEIQIIGHSSPEYPLQKKRHSFEFLREIAHLRPRSNTFSAVFRVRSLTAFAINKFFTERGFVYVHTPIISGSDCEGAGEMFQVTTMDLKNMPKKENGEINFADDFFGKRVGLTVSGQLEAEVFAMAFNKVYTFGPTFRAENSNTKRHASEFLMIEPEIAFSDLKDDMDLAEEFVKYVINYVREQAPKEMEFFNKFIDTELNNRLDVVVNSPFERITYTEAVEILEKSGQKFEYPVGWGKELQTEHERYLTEVVYKKPVFVTNYPKDFKAFYMRQNDDNKTVAAMDLLVSGVGEIIGGSQREERLEKLEKRMEEMKLDTNDYWWYLDLRRYGGVPHAGFGLGFERLIMYLTGMENIRDVIPFPRTPKNAEF
jgi:asparaginyl-tRNA synthetase